MLDHEADRRTALAKAGILEGRELEEADSEEERARQPLGAGGEPGAWVVKGRRAEVGRPGRWGVPQGSTPPSSPAKNRVTWTIASARAAGSVPTVAPEQSPCLLWLRTSGRYRTDVPGESKLWWAPG